MKNTRVIIIIFLSGLLLPSVYSQSDSIPSRPGISIFIKGHRGENYISVDVFNRGFELELSDTTYTPEHTLLCWDNADGITCLGVRGSRVSFDTIKTKDWFRAPAGKALVTLDHILLKKDGLLYRGAPVVFNLVPAAELAAIYDTLAKTAAFIPSYRHQFLLPRSLLGNGFTLDLDDTSYTLLSFIISFDYHDKDEPVSFYCEGNSLKTTLPGYQQALARLTYMDGITIESIFARKNGKVYRVPDLSFALQR